MAILALLVALMLVGIQTAREAARNAQCRVNLQQLGSAVAQYEQAFRMYPPGLSEWGGLHVALLPYTDGGSLQQKFAEASRTGATVVLPTRALLICPSDSAPAKLEADANKRVGTNYAGNNGTWQISGGFTGIFGYLYPVISGNATELIRPADVTDGLSNTALLSEILKADNSFHRLRVNWNTPSHFGSPTQLTSFANVCQQLPADPHLVGWQGDNRARGMPWSDGNLGYTLYNHILPPNSPSCYNGTFVPSAISTTSSMHPRGVNLLFADGHVEFIGESIDSRIWSEYGTRS